MWIVYIIIAIIIFGKIGQEVEKMKREGKSEKEITISVIMILLIFGGFVYAFKSCTTLPKKSEAQLKIEREGRREKPLLDFDGAIIGIKPYLQSVIPDKKSIEIIRTSPWNSESNNLFSQYVEFRCRNQYGIWEIIKMKFLTTNDGKVIQGTVVQ